MKNFDSFTDCFSSMKTLGFALVPVENTQENFDSGKLLERDKEREETAKIVKAYIDAYHKSYMDEVLNNESLIKSIDIRDYQELYNKQDKDDADRKLLGESADHLRNQISAFFVVNSKEKHAKIFKKELITEILPEFVTDEKNEQWIRAAETSLNIFLTPEVRTEKIKMFKSFTTYFDKFNLTRKNMYKAEGKHSEIAYRCIDENLPRFLDNRNIYEKIKKDVLFNCLDILNKDFSDYIEDVCDIFRTDYFCYVLSQRGIDLYNYILGGYVLEDGKKIPGINEYINKYNQEHKKGFPYLQPLRKQILSDRTVLSYGLEQLEKKDVPKFVHEISRHLLFSDDGDLSILDKFSEVFNHLEKYDLEHIYLSKEDINYISQKLMGFWGAFSVEWKKEYCRKYPQKKEQTAEAEYKKLKSLSVAEVQRICSRIYTEEQRSESFVIDFYKSALDNLVTDIKKAYETFVNTFQNFDVMEVVTEEETAIIKEIMDELINLERFCKQFEVKDQTDKDLIFYGEFETLYDEVADISRSYNMIRNCMTQKPYSKKKIKLYFGNKGNFLQGFTDSKTEKNDNGIQYGGYLFRKRNQIGEYDYYIGISSEPKLFRSGTSVSPDDRCQYERLDYYQSKEQTIYGKAYEGSYEEDQTNILNHIKNIVSESKHTETIDQLKKLSKSASKKTEPYMTSLKAIDEELYTKVMEDEKLQELNQIMIQKMRSVLKGMIKFTAGQSIVNDIQNHQYDKRMFYELREDIHIVAQSFRMKKYIAISQREFEQALNHPQKPLYLFKITNKDLSYAETYMAGKRKSRGKENLHTLYFKQLMDENQLCIDLGAGEIFFREKSDLGYSSKVLEKGHHYDALKNKFDYPIIKDKRFLYDQFSLHLSVCLNYTKPTEKYALLNDMVRSTLKESSDNYVIGIDRGEKNLLYICVIDGKGKIIKQFSLNSINGKDYQYLLKTREKIRDENRKNWETIENIQKLKEGYLSLAIHEISQLVVKYHAIIAMEDLGSRFKEKRTKFERQIYQKFESMLCNKLAYLVVDKNMRPEEPGGLLNAYQLCRSSEYNTGRQNGIIFYVPAWMTSKIDPVTGFVDLIRPKQGSIEDMKDILRCFDDIRYNSETELFEFDADYSNFPKTSVSFRKKWTICTYGERIDNREKVNLTKAFCDLFADYGIDITGDLQEQILSQSTKDFFKELTRLLKLTLQLRNFDMEEDYIISPVCDKYGVFFDSRCYAKQENPELPQDSDANGAYNIARKAQLIIQRLEAAGKDTKNKAVGLSGEDWMKYTQENEE